MQKLKEILKTIGSIIITALLTLVAAFIVISKRDAKKEKDLAEKAKEDKKNELEKKSADDIAADSPNSNTISSNIEREKEELRKRLRTRFNKGI